MSLTTKEQREEALRNGISLATLYRRLREGWDIEEAVLITPKQTTYTKFTKKQIEIAKRNGLPHHVIRWRIENGWSMKEAITIPTNAHRTFTKEDLATAAQNGIKEYTVKKRVYTLGWDVERAITQPVQKRKTS